jgi:hypothetical protein
MTKASQAACRRTVVLVLGMHRSGTSVLTRLMGRLGAALPRDPNPPAPDNPDGYWEPAGIVRLNEQLLQAAGSAWLDTRPLDLSRVNPALRLGFEVRLSQALAASFGAERCFVLKDPRICRMVPLYRRLLAAAGITTKVVIALRNPAAVAASLYRRTPISPAYAAHLWAHHLLEAERHTRDLSRIVVDYDALVGDWRSTAALVQAFLADELPAAPLDGLASPVVTAYRHHRAGGEAGFDPPLARLLDGIMAALLALDAGPAAAARRLDHLTGALAAAAQLHEAALEAEFRFQRLTSPYDMVRPPDPLHEQQALAAAMARLHRRGWQADPAAP